MGISRVLGPLDAETERGLVLLVHVELDALAAVSMPGALVVLTGTVLFDVIAHDIVIIDVPYKPLGANRCFPAVI